ncbi:hypothetical protein DPMN_105516 [Dreissena polymorpha]|uniref:Uncharacterized protein n=1 Tax=Dreissena polymorpha TaxID=45954 RepID=A0A9D4K3C2_DREPO|nr:hypothetical protein DPMN_105516 [Dreissena polymorpha]
MTFLKPSGCLSFMIHGPSLMIITYRMQMTMLGSGDDIMNQSSTLGSGRKSFVYLYA